MSIRMEASALCGCVPAGQETATKGIAWNAAIDPRCPDCIAQNVQKEVPQPAEKPVPRKRPTSTKPTPTKKPTPRSTSYTQRVVTSEDEVDRILDNAAAGCVYVHLGTLALFIILCVWVSVAIVGRYP